MIEVDVFGDYDPSVYLRQSPEGDGIWGNIKINIGANRSCDYALILNKVLKKTTVHCPPSNVWAIMQEPPTELKKDVHKGVAAFHKILTQDVTLRGNKYIFSQPAVPWHVQKSYKYLQSCPIPAKTHDLTFITSNLSVLSGHRSRMKFLHNIQDKLEFDLFGRGFTPIEDKWDVLSSYKYCIAVENYQNPYYWTEKIADCFLSWTMPIYYGCSRITDFFPSESMVIIDINDPSASDIISDAIRSDTWSNRLDAIAYARELVLNRYQFLPLMAGMIETWENTKGIVLKENKTDVKIYPTPKSRRGIIGMINRNAPDLMSRIQRTK
jgi:hypothetical protein